MSSKYVRSTLEAHLAATWTDTPIHVVDDIDDITAIPLNTQEAWLGIEYVAATDVVNCLPANMWNERGTIFLHLVIPNGWQNAVAVDLGDKLQKSLRGLRLGTLVIESVSPALSQSPPSVEWGSSWQGFALILDYQSIRS